MFKKESYRGCNFLCIKNDRGELLSPSHLNLGPWLRLFGGEGTTYWSHFVRLVSNHFSCGKFWQRFSLPGEGVMCQFCDLDLFEDRDHILYWCPSVRRKADLFSVNGSLFVDAFRYFIADNPQVGDFADKHSVVGVRARAVWFLQQCLIWDPGGQHMRMLRDRVVNRFLNRRHT
jgi:hypothetical protein